MVFHISTGVNGEEDFSRSQDRFHIQGKARHAIRNLDEWLRHRLRAIVARNPACPRSGFGIGCC